MSQQAIDDLYDEGVRNYWKSHNFAELPDRALDVITEYAHTLPARDDGYVAWVRECYDALAEYATDGTYVTFISEQTGEEQFANR